jgi:hypothetical protein
MTKRLSIIIIAFAMLIALSGVAMAADLCPFVNPNTPQGFPLTTTTTSTAGTCNGITVVGADFTNSNYEKPSYNSMAYNTLTLASGVTDYALDVSTVSQGITTSLNTQKGVINQGAMSDSEGFGYMVVNAPTKENVTEVPILDKKGKPTGKTSTVTTTVPDLVNSACYMGAFNYLSMNGEASIGTQLSLNSGISTAPVNSNYQFGISGVKEGSLASGMTSLNYGFKTIDYTGVSQTGGKQVWSGNYEFAHTNKLVITN